jgi:hypothetical protein
LEEAQLRLSANLIAAITAALVLQAGLCPSLCFARSAGPVASQQENASVPEKAPCHETSNAPTSGEAPEGCEGDCSRFESVALATSDTRVVLDAPAAAFAVMLFSLLSPAQTIPVSEFKLAPAPPPRNLLLVKNSFLI